MDFKTIFVGIGLLLFVVFVGIPCLFGSVDSCVGSAVGWSVDQMMPTGLFLLKLGIFGAIAFLLLNNYLK